jgi:hypothetical protein
LVITDLGLIGVYYGYKNKSMWFTEPIIPIGFCLGHVTSGFVSKITDQRYKLPRPVILTFPLIIHCAGHLLAVFNVPNGIYVMSFIATFCEGAQTTLLLTIIS